jgi:hypothetical protein
MSVLQIPAVAPYATLLQAARTLCVSRKAMAVAASVQLTVVLLT